MALAGPEALLCCGSVGARDGIAVGGRVACLGDFASYGPSSIAGRFVLNRDIPKHSAGGDVVGVVEVADALETRDAARAIGDCELIAFKLTVGQRQCRSENRRDEAQDS